MVPIQDVVLLVTYKMQCNLRHSTERRLVTVGTERGSVDMFNKVWL